MIEKGIMIDTDNGIHNALDEVCSNVENIYPAVEKQQDVLNIIDFAKQELGIDLWLRQRFILKVFYNLPLTGEEKKEIKWLHENKGLEIPENYQYINFKELVIVAGRRSSKSVLASLIAIYEIYKLLSLYNPQKFYGLMSGTPIYILHCAAESKQAEIIQDYIKGYLKESNFFDQYIEHESGKEIRFKTQFDKKTNQDKGSLRIYSLTSNSSSIPGRTALMVIMDEVAYMMDTNGRLSGDKIYQALTPSIKNFKEYGKIVNISSPLTKAGVLYDLYISSQKVQNMIAFSYACWQLNPNLTIDEFESDFEKNPEWAMMEYGGEFGEVLDAAFDWDKIDKMVDKGRSISMTPLRDMTYVISCDPATIKDRYFIAWGHAEYRNNLKYVIIDGLHYWESTVTKDEQGEKHIEEVKIDDADNFVIDLMGKLKNVTCIAYDQGKSTSSIQKFKKMRKNAIETTFTNKYKTTLYNDMKGIMNQERLRIYETDSQNAVNIFLDETRHLERQIKGSVIKIGHPMVGPVTTDDAYDAVSNLVHLLLEDNPKKIKRITTAPARIVKTRSF
jgi:hypothetical protein